jgi:cytochrome c556
MVVGFVVAAGLMLALGASAIGQGGEGDVKKIAALIKKGDMVGAKKAAEAAAKGIEIEDVMNLFKPAKKKGIGVTGSEQGIEQALIALGREAPTPAKMAKMAEAYEEMGYNFVAIGIITEHKFSGKDSGKMTKKAWLESTTGMVETGVKLAEAAKSKSAADVKTQAAKVNNNCNNCHTTFR